MWKLDGTRGTLDVPELSASVDLSEPQQGLRVTALRHAGETVPLAEHQILQVHFARQLIAEDVQDSWIRGADLVVAYSQRKSRQVSAEIYWRLVRACTNAVGTELILSVQTDLLDANPAARASSQMKSQEVLWLGDPESPQSASRIDLNRSPFHIDSSRGQGIFVFRFPGSAVSYVDMLHPTDFSAVEVTVRNEQAIVQWRLFPESLEKGVIRRARLRGLFVDRRNDLQSAAECFQEFKFSSPPLTT